MERNNSTALLKVNSYLRVALTSGPLSNGHVDSKTIRRENLLGILKEYRYDADFARAYDLSEGLISQIKNGTRKIGDDLARKIEDRMKKPKGWMDSLQFRSAEDEMSTQEAVQILQALTDEDRESWLKHGRLLSQRGPKGPNNPFGGPGTQ